jgi:hypothetical protein
MYIFFICLWKDFIFREILEAQVYGQGIGFVDGISVHKTIGDDVGTAVGSNEGS